MTQANEYRSRAAELNAQADVEKYSFLKSGFEQLAQIYLRLAEQVDGDSQIDNDPLLAAAKAGENSDHQI